MNGAVAPGVYHWLFGLLSVTGLRVSEALNLELHDVDLDAAVLTIRGAKFGKTRLVPLHASTCHVLADYLRRRARHWAARPVSSYVFVSSWGNRLDGGDIQRTFYALSRQIGLRGPPTVMARDCMTYAIGSRLRRSCAGTGPARPRAPFAALVGLSGPCARRRHPVVLQRIPGADA